MKKKKGKESNKQGTDLFDSLTSIRFESKGKTYELDMGSELLISEEDLHGQVERIPAVLGYFGSIVALLEKDFENKKDIKKSIEAKIDRSLREQGIVGEQRIDKAVKRHPKWIEVSLDVNTAREKLSRAKGFIYALREKSVVLISRSSDIRSTPEDRIMGVRREEIINYNYEDWKIS